MQSVYDRTKSQMSNVRELRRCLMEKINQGWSCLKAALPPLVVCHQNALNALHAGGGGSYLAESCAFPVSSRRPRKSYRGWARLLRAL